MKRNPEALLKASVARDGFFPRVFKWHDKSVRVLAVESVSSSGTERRCCVRTAEGRFELGSFGSSGQWHVRRGPSWLNRVLVRWQNPARYPLPAWRRRKGGADANGPALV